MRRARWLLPLPLLLLSLPGCDQARTNEVVQAAARKAAEAGEALTAKAEELTGMSREEARAKVQELLDVAADELREVRDSETAQRLVAEVQEVLQTLGVFAQRVAQKLNLAALEETLDELLTRFKNDPRVVETLESLREKLDALGR